MKFRDLFTRVPGIGLYGNDGFEVVRATSSQLPSSLDAFQIDADNFCLRVLDKILEIIDFVQVDFVAHAHNFGDPTLALERRFM